MDESAVIVRDYAWSERKNRSHNLQWTAWNDSCEEYERRTVAVVEGHLVAFTGKLKTGIERGEIRLVSKSGTQYLSAVRQMHTALTGKVMAPFTYLDMFLRAKIGGRRKVTHRRLSGVAPWLRLWRKCTIWV